jgi:hypothetical protein
MPPRYTGKYDDCPDGKELEGKALEVTLKYKQGGSSVLKLKAGACRQSYDREDPQAAPFTIRRFDSADGALLSTYSTSGRATSTMQILLPDRSDSASLIPPVKTADLVSGNDVALGEILFVKLDKSGQNGTVTHADVWVRAVKP